ncbi:MAG: ImmA/IrrE family metallo-endopeptidase [Clostridia bacterium]|nr:ImmA/IrrE family metallo-endopeptidase [Clostridia bacterium]MBQ9995870.1 ImmA/IrrE family metallo-endopeptidase [Clostridia bacterium]
MTDSIIEKAERLTAKYNTRNPYTIAAQLGIHVLNFDTPGTLKGMYSVIKRSRFIFVNESLDDELRRFVCAHELGHDILHRKIIGQTPMSDTNMYGNSSRMEYEANVFAAAILIDRKRVLKYAMGGRTSTEIAALLHVDVNLISIMIDQLIREGYALNPVSRKNNILK